MSFDYVTSFATSGYVEEETKSLSLRGRFDIIYEKGPGDVVELI